MPFQKGHTLNRGKKHTPESRANMSAAMKGNTNGLGATRTPEVRAKIGAAHKGNTNGLSHEMSRTTIYKIWNAMIQRTTNSNNASWKNYGGRGITCCQRWQDSFVMFLYDMGPRPPGLTLQRSPELTRLCS